MIFRSLAGAALSATIALSVPALAQDTDEVVASFTDWYVFNPSDPRECYIVSEPKSWEARRNGSAVSGVRRGDIRLFVTIRPGAGVNKEVSFTGGYPFREGSTADVRIAGEDYAMNVGSGDNAEWAWPASPDADTNLVAAMERGAEATVTAVSARGTTTVDNFSLIGFTAALNKAEELCN